MSCVESVCQKSLRESVEHAGRLVAACIEVVCASGVFGLITSRYLNCLSDLILKAFTPKTSAYYNTPILPGSLMGSSRIGS